LILGKHLRNWPDLMWMRARAPPISSDPMVRLQGRRLGLEFGGFGWV
jgi:hypothetical protein